MKEEEAPDLQQRSENPSVQFRAYVYVFFSFTSAEDGKSVAGIAVNS